MMSVALVFMLFTSSTSFIVRLPSPGLSRRAAAVTMQLPSDADLFASLRKRTETATEEEAPAPLGPDEVGADQMGPSDVVSYCLRAIKAGSEEDFDGLKALMSFAVKHDDGRLEDLTGQVQPGSFGTPAELFAYLKQHPRYQTLAQLSEWKPMGSPDTSNMSRNAVQKLLVRREGANWEDLFINMQLAEIKGTGDMPTRRWLITSIYKQGTP